MKRLLPLLLVCALLLPLCALGETVPAFADEGVRSAVCLQLGLDASGLTAALSSLTELTIDGKPISFKAPFRRLTMTDANNWKQSSFWMRSAAYCRLKNIQLSYTLPRTWLKKLRMKSAMVFVNAQNLFTITDFYQGFDPEVAYSGSGDGVELGAVAYNYPQVKVVTMGVELKF